MKKANIKKSGDFDEYLIEALKDKELAVEYLNEAVKDSDYRVFLLALGKVAKAVGYAELARLTGIERTALYKMLSDTGNPTLASVYDLLQALGVHIQLGLPLESSEQEVDSTFSVADNYMPEHAPNVAIFQAGSALPWGDAVSGWHGICPETSRRIGSVVPFASAPPPACAANQELALAA